MFIESTPLPGIIEISLNRPEIHNAFNDELINQLTERFTQLSSDANVRAIIISGQGRSFCAGADLKWMKKMVDYSLEENIADSKKLAQLFATINRCKKPVIAKVGGAAIGGGVGIVAACDFVIASERAKFAFSEVRLGIIPAVISPFVISKIGVSSARAYFLSGARFSATKAAEMGLVHQVVPAQELEQVVIAQAKLYLAAGPQAVGYAKELIEEVINLGPQECHQYTYEQIAKLRISEEGQEGMSALLEKRVPNWVSEE